MAVGAPVSLTSGTDTTAATSYATASVTPTAGRVVILITNNTKGSAVNNVNAISGCGLTWTFIGRQRYDSIASPTSNLEAWWGYAASPSSGAVTIDFGGGNTQTSCSWSLVEVPGVDATTPIVASSFQSNASDTTGTTASVTLNTIASTDNGLIVGVSLPASAAITERTNWTELHDISGSAPTSRLETQYLLAVDDDGSATWTGNQRWGILGFELAATVAGDPVELFRGRSMIAMP